MHVLVRRNEVHTRIGKRKNYVRVPCEGEKVDSRWKDKKIRETGGGRWCTTVGWGTIKFWKPSGHVIAKEDITLMSGTKTESNCIQRGILDRLHRIEVGVWWGLKLVHWLVVIRSLAYRRLAIQSPNGTHVLHGSGIASRRERTRACAVNGSAYWAVCCSASTHERLSSLVAVASAPACSAVTSMFRKQARQETHGVMNLEYSMIRGYGVEDNRIRQCNRQRKEGGSRYPSINAERKRQTQRDRDDTSTGSIGYAPSRAKRTITTDLSQSKLWGKDDNRRGMQSDIQRHAELAGRICAEEMSGKHEDDRYPRTVVIRISRSALCTLAAGCNNWSYADVNARKSIGRFDNWARQRSRTCSVELIDNMEEWGVSDNVHIVLVPIRAAVVDAGPPGHPWMSPSAASSIRYWRLRDVAMRA
ncbi:hypothetical protein EDB85DRAFT_2275542 [Lactarius pseudohatsudake]|nr:hypothetical protein EDB85DRAFT_2275542 [Lactarius pseudohatsudake]